MLTGWNLLDRGCSEYATTSGDPNDSEDAGAWPRLAEGLWLVPTDGGLRWAKAEDLLARV